MAEPTRTKVDIPATLPLLPIRDIVIFPNMVVPLFVGREASVRAVDAAMEKGHLIVLVAQRAVDTENPQPGDLYNVGVVGTIMRMLKLQDRRVKILVQGVARVRITAFVQTEPFPIVALDRITEPEQMAVGPKDEALLRMVKGQIKKMLEYGKPMPQEMIAIIEHLDDPGRMADLIVANFSGKTETAQSVLEAEDAVTRLRIVSALLSHELEILSVRQKIHNEARGEMDKTQREYFLREEMKAIQRELGNLDGRADEAQQLRKRIAQAKMPKKVAEEAERQVKRLERMHSESAEASIVLTYLEWLVDLPWSKSTTDHLDIARAKNILDADHYGMEKVKERILEYLAIRKMKGKKKMKGPILCFVGPPGVGKTSMGRSIARAIGRKFVRISLGGIRDEAEIRGHRRTYVGALPGRIIQGMKQAGSKNPLFMLDEIDKIGLDFRGDPSSALLEVLDPEQNSAFSDHYLSVPFDLSDVMFITTANQIDPLTSPLRDRMEVIDLSGYTPEEKVQIGRRFLLPRQLKEHGLKPKMVTFSDAALEHIVTHYTWEAGVRNLEREIARLLRKVARRVAEGAARKTEKITPESIRKYLGVPKYLPEPGEEKDEIGVAVGLAWTAAGGDILRVEATLMKGKGNLTLTGSLGDVMKESANAALSYVRSREAALGIPPGFFGKNDIHIHVPAGAIPKDGPSAGITMVAALASAITRIPLRHDIAMTGEVTLRGHLLSIGGLKEKILAARRAAMRQIILPKKNEKDIEEIPPHILKGIDLFFADRMETVLDKVFVKKKASRPRGKRSAAR